jgi:hypothetical protein
MSYLFDPSLDDEISLGLRITERSKRERWAAFYLLNPPAEIVHDRGEYNDIRKALQREIRTYGYVESESPGEHR